MFTLDGRPVGQVQGTSVYQLNGRYVGELHRDMLVNAMRYRNAPGDVGRSGDPGAVRPPNRGPANYGYPDVFDYLTRAS